MSLGYIVLLLVIFGYISNWLNWHYLNYRLTRYLYYTGACVHESSHALLCLLTGARITEFKVFTSQPHVTYNAPKLPFIGNFFISSAPIFGGLLFLFLVNIFVLGHAFTFSTIDTAHWHSILYSPLSLLAQMNLLQWQSWILLFLLINVGVMIGPSFQDIKNVWPALIILFFIQSPVVANVGLIALNIILAGIIVQLAMICIVKAARRI